MKKLIITLLAISISLQSMAKPVENIDEAIDLVIESVKKNRLLNSLECVAFSAYPIEQGYAIDVREVHNEQCSGDPETAPRLFSYEVDEKTGKMKTDEFQYSKKVSKGKDWDGTMYPIQ